jgi:hypothetical protein
MGKLARVFPRKTSMSPTDENAYFDTPPLFPKYDEVHISVTFTWDIEKGYWLKKQWENVCDNVKIGGVALGSRANGFQSGLYVKESVVVTSRGCPNNCSFCYVPEREGGVRELPIVEGNNIIDNNLLACSRPHIIKVFNMLKSQKKIIFSGGIEAARVSDWFVDLLRSIKLERLYLAYDSPQDEDWVITAKNKLLPYFRREQIGCYVLIGWEGNDTDTIKKAESRLKRTWDIGVMPFAMLYQPKEWINYKINWKRLQRSWTRPAIIKAMMNNGQT